MKIFFKRTIIVFTIILTIWIILGKFVIMKNRMNDSTIRHLFKQLNLSVQLRDTVIDQHNLHYAITGTDTLPTLVFIHGSPGSWSNYRKYMWDEGLRKKYRMIAVDRPGFGYSDFGQALPLITQADLLSRLLQSLNNGKGFILLGHSMGSPVAVQMTINMSTTVHQLVLTGAPLDVALERKEQWRHIMNVKPLCYLLPGAFAPSNTELLALKKELPALQEQYNKITCDVVFMHGDKDDWVPIENVAYGIKTMINAKSIRVDTLKGSGHLFPWEDEEKFKALLMQMW